MVYLIGQKKFVCYFSIIKNVIKKNTHDLKIIIEFFPCIFKNYQNRYLKKKLILLYSVVVVYVEKIIILICLYIFLLYKLYF